ncbi:hypothetical protein F5B20DRAFT_491901 [Whalleya microplaca]|nr:hypothetical protein F5B20DRAFT_491901 [Whalleya microplaca]
MYSTSCPSLELPRRRIYYVQNASPLELKMLEIAELLAALSCSCVTTSYIIQEESGSPPSLIQNILCVLRVDLRTIISPGPVLGSCLVLGCSLSSYMNRRRRQDGYQIVVFVIWIAWAICVGWGTGASADMVTLGVVPWALCAAMLSSFAARAAFLWLENRERSGGLTINGLVDEKRDIEEVLVIGSNTTQP